MQLTEQNVVQASVLFMPNPPPDVSQTVGGVPLLARVYLKLGAWRWHLNPALDEDSVRGNLLVKNCIIISFTPSFDTVDCVSQVMTFQDHNYFQFPHSMFLRHESTRRAFVDISVIFRQGF